MSLSYAALYRQTQGNRASLVAHMSKYAALATASNCSLTSPVLDFGCGWGYLLEALENRGLPCQGVDICRDQVSEAQVYGLNVVHAENSIDWLHEKAEEGQTWSAVFLLDVLEHLSADDQIEVLQLIFRVLPPGGQLIIRSPNPDSIVGMRMAFGDYTHRFTPTADALAVTLKAIGFADVQVRDEIPWTEPYVFEVRPLFLGEAWLKKKKRYDLFYHLSQKVFRSIRRLQIASEIGLETALQLPLSPNYLCMARK